MIEMPLNFKLRKTEDIEKGFGIAKGFSKPFKRDKKTREF